jgi:hypothetical protein
VQIPFINIRVEEFFSANAEAMPAVFSLINIDKMEKGNTE